MRFDRGYLALLTDERMEVVLEEAVILITKKISSMKDLTGAGAGGAPRPPAAPSWRRHRKALPALVVNKLRQDAQAAAVRRRAGDAAGRTRRTSPS
jgi:hypothetical protein